MAIMRQADDKARLLLQKNLPKNAKVLQRDAKYAQKDIQRHKLTAK